MENKKIKKDEIVGLILKERIISIAISLTITFSIVGGTVYTINKFLKKNYGDGIGDTTNNINRESLYRGIINLEKEAESGLPKELATGVKDGFDEYKDSHIQSSGSSSNSSMGENSSVGGSTVNNVVPIDNSSITGRNIRILEGQEFNPVKSLNLRATDINGEDISSKIIIIENTVDIYSPGQYIVKAGAPLSNGAQKEVILTVNVEPTTLNLSVNEFEAVSDFINKGENAVLTLDLYSNKDYISALSVNIDGLDYPVKKVEVRDNSQKYMLELPVGNEPGNIEYNLSSIRMSDNTVIKLNKTVNVTVAKEKPVVSSFTYEETKDKHTSKILMKVELEDKDKALVNEKAWIYIYDENGKIITSQQILSNRINNVRFTALENGIYNIKVAADLDLVGKVYKNEELFVDTIEVNSVDKTNLTGENIKIKLGSDFDPIRDLNIKALDVDGTDITNEVVIEEDKVDINNPGKYIVKVLLVNKNNEEIRKEFTVEVIDSIVRRILGVDSEDNINEEIIVNDEETRNIAYSNRRSTSNIVSGNDTETLHSDLTIKGRISDSNGSAPAGKIEVELPTKATFTVDQTGNFIGSNFTVTNKSTCDVSLSVGQFIEGNPGGGITIDNNIADYNSVGRSTVSLKLHATSAGVNKEVNLDSSVSNVDLVMIPANNSATIQVLGEAGTKESVKEDENGVSESFILKFRIKKA